VLRWLPVPVFLLLSVGVFGQGGGALSNLRFRYVSTRVPNQTLDTLSIAGATLVVRDSVDGTVVSADYYRLKQSMLVLDTAALRRAYPASSTVQVQYRVLPFDLSKPLFRLDSTALRRVGQNDAIEYDFTPYKPNTQPWQTGGVQSNGAYVRGLSLGNNQNLVFNSNLNLQLNGKLGDDLAIQAALSDNSIPLQPDGTTRQLQEFDRIYIQLQKKEAQLIAGDFDLRQPPGYFSRYFKRLQGAGVLWKGPLTTGDSLSVQAAAAVSRGKFARQLIQGQEGNQGPYRLVGADGEQFIIVLAGTEKVYVDGQLLRRGFEDDYTVDYNLGELTFTARRLITKDIRVIVEFEYTVQAYLRSTTAAQAAWTAPRAKLYLNAYSEQDSRNAGPAQDLSPEARRRLADAGDNLSAAFASGIDTLTDGFDPGRVLYKTVDTVACGQPTQVLVYSTSPDSALYAARFTQVPQGTGNYVQVPSAANGRVYRWVAPDPVSCQPQGNYEPIVRLLAPETRQLFAMGAEVQPFSRGRLQTEVALSGRDLNRYSPLDDEDNNGLAFSGAYRHELLQPGSSKGWALQADGRYEYTARHFLPLNPYRPAEFARDWNTGATNNPAAEQWVRGGVSAQKDAWIKARYEAGGFFRDSLYRGLRHFAEGSFKRGGWDARAELNLLQTDATTEKTLFSRPKAEIARSFFRGEGQKRQAFVRIGVYGERERNSRRLPSADTLLLNSFWYDLWRVFLETPQSDQSRWQWNAFYSQRTDHAPVADDFRVSTIADEVKLGGTWRSLESKPARQSLQWNLHYRTLRIAAAELTPLDEQQTYLGRVDYSLTALKNAVSATSGYELSSGQSPRIEFNYIQVNPGEGQYTWVDRNLDSILQIDEMEISVFQDQANYVRVAVTTTEYLRTNNVVFNQNLRFEPRLLWPGAKGWRKGLGRLSTQSILQLNRRVLSGAEGVNAWNPFELNIPDTSLITVGSTLRNVLFVNRAQPAWDASVSNNATRSQVLLTTGFENRQNNAWNLHGRVNAGPKWSVEIDLTRDRRESDNEAFDARDYTILGCQAGPKLSWLPNRYLRASVQYRLLDSRNQVGNTETARQDNLQLSVNWNPAAPKNNTGFAAATAFRLQLTYADVRFDGDANTPVGFAMLEGLQNGNNALWTVGLDRQLSRSIQLNFSYEGRRTGQARTVHVARAQVRAVF